MEELLLRTVAAFLSVVSEIETALGNSWDGFPSVFKMDGLEGRERSRRPLPYEGGTFMYEYPRL